MGNCPWRQAQSLRKYPPEPPEGGRLGVKAAPAMGFESFTLGPFMRCLDGIEFHGRSAERAIDDLRSTRGAFGRSATRPAQSGLVAWTARAVTCFLAARGRFEAETEPVRDVWVIQHPSRTGATDARGAVGYEQTAWGRRYASPDGRVRELWLPSFSGQDRERSRSELIMAAHICFRGVPCEEAYARHWHPASQRADRVSPHLVRIVEFNGTSGAARIHEFPDAAETRASYQEQVVPLLTAAASGTRREAGRDCAECREVEQCPEVRRSPGLITIGRPASSQLPPRLPAQRLPTSLQSAPGTSAPTTRRTISASDLRAYRDCPAKYHLTRQLHLGDAQLESAQIQTGRMVDDWLNRAHGGGSWAATGCRELSLPAAAPERSGPDPQLVTAMVAQHRNVCPLDRLHPSEQVFSQRTFACYDPDLNLVWIAKPDLVYSKGRTWIWRETKTSGRARAPWGSFFDEYPQLALAVLMMSSGALMGSPSQWRIELETLYPDDWSLEDIDPGLDETVAEARAVITKLAVAWYSDTTLGSTPGRACGGCEVKEICPDAQR